jgi:putative ABC transport system substrate-binding protein
MMNRRTVIASFAGGLIVWPAARAQPTNKVYRIAILVLNAQADDRDVTAFRERLAQLGYAEGRNVRIEVRSADRQAERLPELAAAIARSEPDVIVTITTPAAVAAKNATSTIPIVMAGSANPVGMGLVASMARPGGNVTGVTNNPGPGFVVKQLQLLKEAAPRISRVAILKSNYPIEDRSFAAMQEAGHALGLTPIAVIIDSPTQPDVAALLTAAHPDALYVFPQAVNDAHAETISGYAAKNRLPTMYGDGHDVEQGGLMSYWVNWLELRRHAAIYVDKILRGARPADLPVEDPTRFELIINLKTAKALGLTIPPSVLLLADQIVQ